MIDDIRDIRAPLPIHVWWHWPLVIAMAAIAALGVVLLVRWWRRRRAARSTPLERARQALLSAEAHARAGRSHEWADVVAETVRGALASRVGVAVLPQTTTELATAPWAQAAERGGNGGPAPPEVEPLPEAPSLLALLAGCDLARFAKAKLDTDTLLAETVLARELVESLFAAPSLAATTHPSVTT